MNKTEINMVRHTAQDIDDKDFERASFQVNDGEEVFIPHNRDEQAFVCCDCGLVHFMTIKRYQGGALGFVLVRSDEHSQRMRDHQPEMFPLAPR